MGSPLPFPLGKLIGIPSDVVGALRVLPLIAEHTEAMRAHTAVLEEIADGIKGVSSDTEALVRLERDMRRVAETTAVLGPMDGRMATIEGAMPTLVDVQRDLASLPETLERLDGSMDRLSTLLEELLDALQTLSGSVAGLQQSVQPLGRIARRLPGQG
jgi:PAS domain-containing protein